MSIHEELKLENQLCFAIYACSREITKLYQPFLDKLGVTYSQYLVLMVLWEHKECTVKDIGEKLYLDSGTLTPLLKRMQSAGLINRERSANDERKVMITLTEEGAKLHDEALHIPLAMRSGTSEDDEQFTVMLNQFKGLLAKVHDANVESKQQ
ncbi:MarR family winged helix-turn-helix transcriptional regulator [Paenibacillus shunpengii]|uniref:MarR family winged helix-turn-helix transcriptional regulator n=1 Tax=Paenibacillus shunpengii TaxID=2054424 RepID=A0ABW5SL39_9BACL|nr:MULTISPECIES: MarR family transcriptional regulator [unclassified Paenibacillus]OMC71027.1 MarR family transcriptional regulator [Paenibacillus sp. FSL H7-0326]SDW16713.1 MarR family protein [Paenibacillus sp. PDC88]